MGSKHEEWFKKWCEQEITWSHKTYRHDSWGDVTDEAVRTVEAFKHLAAEDPEKTIYYWRRLARRLPAVKLAEECAAAIGENVRSDAWRLIFQKDLPYGEDAIKRFVYRFMKPCKEYLSLFEQVFGDVACYKGDTEARRFAEKMSWYLSNQDKETKNRVASRFVPIFERIPSFPNDPGDVCFEWATSVVRCWEDIEPTIMERILRPLLDDLTRSTPSPVTMRIWERTKWWWSGWTKSSVADLLWDFLARLVERRNPRVVELAAPLNTSLPHEFPDEQLAQVFKDTEAFVWLDGVVTNRGECSLWWWGLQAAFEAGVDRGFLENALRRAQQDCAANVLARDRLLSELRGISLALLTERGLGRPSSRSQAMEAHSVATRISGTEALRWSETRASRWHKPPCFEQFDAAVRSGNRFVILTGPPGTGKTWLPILYAALRYGLPIPAPDDKDGKRTLLSTLSERLGVLFLLRCRPNWTSPRPLLGGWDINGKWSPGLLEDFLEEANKKTGSALLSNH